MLARIAPGLLLHFPPRWKPPVGAVPRVEASGPGRGSKGGRLYARCPQGIPTPKVHGRGPTLCGGEAWSDQTPIWEYPVAG
jgi:hypothetical protein